MRGTARAATLGLVLALGGATVATPVYAQSAAELSKARTLFRQGVSLEAAGDWAGALSKFEGVAKVKLSPQVRFHLGRCKENLGRLNEALGDYRMAEYEAQQTKAKEAGQISEAREALEKRIPKLVINRGEGAETARIELDSVDVGEAKLGKEFAVDPGQHHIVATIPGKGHFDQDVTIAEGETKTVDLVPPPELLHKTTGPEESNPAETPPEEPKPTPPPEKHSVVPWVIGGVGVASLAASGVFYILRNGAKSDLDSGCRGSVCPARLSGTQDKGKLYSTLTGVTLGVGVVGVGVAAVMLLGGGSSDKPPPAQQDEDTARNRLRFDVVTTPSLTGVNVAGTF